MYGMTKTRPFLQLTLVLGLALGAAGCSTISDLDPTGLLSDDSSAPPPPVAATTAPGTPAADTDVNATPDLANLPSRPQQASTPGQQQATTRSVNADGAQARYSADALRAGTEAEAAPPPPPTTDAAVAAQIAAASAPPPGPDMSAPAQAPAAPMAQPAPVQTAALKPPVESSVSEPSAPAVPAAPVKAAAPNPASMPSVPPGAQPAVPPDTPVRTAAMAMGNQSPSDAVLGFKPSSAPPLDPSIGEWVPAPIVAHYRRTASNAGIIGSGTAVPPIGEASSGAVVANLNVIGSPNARITAMNGGVPPAAVIYFPGDRTTLSAAARTEIRKVVTQYKAAGTNASIRVVGHASSRTADMPVEKHLEVIFKKSQARADAVAQELIHEGVPADKVLIEAVGDSQPVYYESMPKGEDGNRRAEIFVLG
jgi:outer membrane protein OmpA-like peptidoglycan-associated protein